MNESEHDVLAYMTFPARHRTKLHGTNLLERLHKESSGALTSSASSQRKPASPG